jgi:hypothetical protein
MMHKKYRYLITLTLDAIIRVIWRARFPPFAPTTLFSLYGIHANQNVAEFIQYTREDIQRTDSLLFFSGYTIKGDTAKPPH